MAAAQQAAPPASVKDGMPLGVAVPLSLYVIGQQKILLGTASPLQQRTGIPSLTL